MRNQEMYITDAVRTAQMCLREAQEFIPYQPVTEHTVYGVNNPTLPRYMLKVSLHYPNPDTSPSEKTITLVEKPPVTRHWTNILERASYEFSYQEVDDNGKTQAVVAIRRGEKVVYTSTRTAETVATDNQLNFLDRLALRRMAPHMPGLTTDMIKGFGHNEPTQPLNK